MSNYQKINDKLCKALWDKFPKQSKKIFAHGSGDIGGDFLGFVDTYYYLAQMIPKDWRVIDFGCSYAPQAYYFQSHREYIGVNISSCPKWKFDNGTYFTKSIKDWIENAKKESFDFNHKTFAICNYVPSGEVYLVRQTFFNLFIFN